MLWKYSEGNKTKITDQDSKLITETNEIISHLRNLEEIISKIILVDKEEKLKEFEKYGYIIVKRT